MIEGFGTPPLSKATWKVASVLIVCLCPKPTESKIGTPLNTGGLGQYVALKPILPSVPILTFLPPARAAPPPTSTLSKFS